MKYVPSTNFDDLRRRMNAVGLTGTEAARRLGWSKNVVNNWLGRIHKPTTSFRLDLLIQVIEEAERAFVPVPTFDAAEYRQQMAHKRLTVANVAQSLGLSPITVDQWVSGRRNPTAMRQEQLKGLL